MAHADQYYFPHGSRLPFFGSVSLFIMMAGAAATLNGAAIGGWVLGLGVALLCTLFFLWFREVVNENQAGLYNEQVDRSFRMGMMWFIFSEVMFFAAFFGALFYARQLSIPWLGGEGAKAVTSLLWPDFDAGWPSNGPGDLGPRDDGSYEIIPAFGLHAINTALLLTSGLTITVAHHALKSGHRGILKVFLALTFLLGFIFLGVQVKEYGHAFRPVHGHDAVKAWTAYMIATNEIASRHRVDLDTTIKTLAETGKDMSAKYKETSEAGLASNLVLC